MRPSNISTKYRQIIMTLTLFTLFFGMKLCRASYDPYFRTEIVSTADGLDMEERKTEVEAYSGVVAPHVCPHKTELSLVLLAVLMLCTFAPKMWKFFVRSVVRRRRKQMR